MGRFLAWLATTAVAVATASWLFDGIGFRGAQRGVPEIEAKIVDLLIVSLILGLLTVFVKPILQLVSLPLIILTLGLFLLVINAGLLLLVDAIAGELGIAFFVNGFWTAVGGAIVITVVTWLVDAAVGFDD